MRVKNSGNVLWRGPKTLEETKEKDELNNLNTRIQDRLNRKEKGVLHGIENADNVLPYYGFANTVRSINF